MSGSRTGELSEDNSEFPPDSILRIPSEVIHDDIGPFLNTSSEFALSRSCWTLHNLFADSLRNQKNECFLLDFVMHADEHRAALLLDEISKINKIYVWRAILKRHAGTEPCGRKWKSVSALEFAAWAGDKFMVDMLLGYIPEQQRPAAHAQLKGVLYNGTEYGEHLSFFEPLLQAYTAYARRVVAGNIAELFSFWIDQIDAAQKTLPHNIQQEYQKLHPNTPIPAFDKPPQRNIEPTHAWWPLRWAFDSAAIHQFIQKRTVDLAAQVASLNPDPHPDTSRPKP